MVLIFVVYFETSHLGAMITMIFGDKCSTTVILAGAKYTHGKITLSFSNQLSKQDQVTNTHTNERYCTILMIRGGRLAKGTMHCTVLATSDET